MQPKGGLINYFVTPTRALWMGGRKVGGRAQTGDDNNSSGDEFTSKQPLGANVILCNRPTNS